MARLKTYNNRRKRKPTEQCMTCGGKAVWDYAPSDGKGFYCDDCVSRGCSCQVEFSHETGEWDGPESTDEKGRLRPCVEYWYWPDGVPKGMS